MPLLTVPGDNPVELHYEVAGVGRPVVLIHGWPLSARSWEAQVPALVDAGHQVIVYDRRGFGDSSQPWNGYDYDTFAADLDALLTELDAHDVVLVGFSMGGGEVARYIGRYGTGRVGAAVFAAAVPPYLYRTDDNPDGGLDDATIEQFEAGIAGDRPAFLEGFTRDFMSSGDDVRASDATLRYLRTVAEFASPKATLDCVAAFGRTDFRSDLESVTVPTLVIHGDSDAIVPFEVSGRRTHDAIAGSTLVVIEGGPHGINASHPDEFNRALLEFLADGPTTAAEPTSPRSAQTAVVDSAVPDQHAVSDRQAPTDTVEQSAPGNEPLLPRDEEPPPRAMTDADDQPPTEATAVSADGDDRGEPPQDPEREAVHDGGDPRGEGGDADLRTTSTTAPGDGDEAERLAGLTWRTAEADDPTNRADEPTGQHAQRTGWTADPNLGDVPVDRQPHPGG